MHVVPELIYDVESETRVTAITRAPRAMAPAWYMIGAVLWQELGDSNPRPSVLETDALPTELNSCAVSRIAGRGGHGKYLAFWCRGAYLQTGLGP